MLTAPMLTAANTTASNTPGPDALTAVPADPLGKGLHPLAAVAQLASLFSGRPAPHATDIVDGPTPGPETFSDVARRLGLAVEIRQVKVRALQPGDFPCIVLLKDGSARIAARRLDADRIELVEPAAAGEAGRFPAPAADLAARSSGTIFRARPAANAAAAEHKPSGLHSDLLAAVRGRVGIVLTLVAAGFASNLITLAMPLFTMTVFDRIVPHAATETLWALAIGITLLLLIDFGLRQARLTLFDALALVAGQSMVARLYSTLVRMPLAAMPRNAGPLVQPFGDLTASNQVLLQFCVALVVDLPFFAVVIAVLAFLGGPIAFVPLVAAGLLFAVCAATHGFAHKAALDETRSAQRQWQMLIEAVSAIETIKATHAGVRLLGDWERRSDDAAYSAHRPRIIHGFSAHAGAFIAQFVVVATVVIGVDQIGRANMTLGALSASMLLVSRCMTPVAALIAQFFRLRQLRTTTRGLAAILDTAPEKGADPTFGAVPRGGVECRSVTFRYPGSGDPALRDIRLSLAPGERVGLVGRAGCGKTTLLKLLARLHEPDEGAISLDGRDIRQFDPDVVRGQFALMTQESALLEGTLGDALTLGLGPVDAARFDAVAKLTGLAEVAGRHPSGYGLDIGPGGRRLSGGERQAASLARALMAQPALLLLDEPTSAMDNEREARIIAGLAALPPETGMVIATHRLPALAVVNRVIWLEAGRIVADGPREEIFRKLGVNAAARSNHAA